MDKVFAPGRPTFQEGNYTIYDYPPRDTSFREKFFSAGMKHQAKYNCIMLADVIEYVSEPGERVMDIMSGTGSIMIAATMGRKVTCIEISKIWTRDFIEENKKTILERFPAVRDEDITIINSACQNILPLPCDHIIFSPPYSVIMKHKTISAGDLVDDFYGTSAEEFAEYSNTPGNVGGQNQFMYSQMMAEIYKKCLGSVRPGGTMTVVIKDHIEKGKRVFLSEWVLKWSLSPPHS